MKRLNILTAAFAFIFALICVLAACAVDKAEANGTTGGSGTTLQVTEEEIETEKQLYTTVSDKPTTFSFNSGASDSARSAAAVGSDDQYGCRFWATAPFDSLAVSCPSYSDNIGSLTFTLYRWDTGFIQTVNGEALCSETFVDFGDNATLVFDFDELQPGQYMLVLSGGKSGVGVWMFSESETGTFIYNNGLESEGVFTMEISYTSTPDVKSLPCESTVDYSTEVTTPEEIVPDENDAVVTLDAMPDTWAATDALGRTLPGNDDTGGVREGKYVGIFFWTWHCSQSQNRAINVNDLIEQYPDAQNDYTNSIWKDNQTGAYHWDEPVYGYYDGTDEWVLRRQAELLANSGVDVVIFDNTNGTATWRSGFVTLCKVFEEAREQGVNTPKISFLLPFSDGPDTVTQLREIYLTIFRDGLYRDLWFYWEGKPLLMSNYKKLDRNDPIESEIYNFFTFRPGEPTYNSKRQITNGTWTWLSVYPQAVTYRADGSAEQMTVGVAQNWSAEIGLTAMNGKNIFGRTYTSKGYDTREDAKLWGANFNEQFEYALEVDPDFIFVTGWNEWIAGRYETWQSVKNAFPDEFNDTFSRDIEPSKGDLADNYYYQLVSFVRRYKGTRAVPASSVAKTIDITSTSDQWAEVLPRHIAYEGNTFDRDHRGYGDLHYADASGRNDITLAKIARDGENIYFMAECAGDITAYEADTGWMRLYIDTGDSDAANWETFEYMVEPGESDAVVYRSKGGWDWEEIARVPYTVRGNRIQLVIKRATLGLEGNFTLCFKWSDNVCLNGDILDFYTGGDVAPGGRFKYQYKSEE